MLSMSDTKKSKNQSIDNRTTKTKASATKPQVFGISLTRNKNNHNPALFNSVKKKTTLTLGQTPQSYQYQSEKKHNQKIKTQLSLFEELHTRVSIDYINSLHSDLLIQLGHQLESQLESKENYISAGNVSIALPSKQQRECFRHLKDLIHLKSEVNQSYKCMQNTQNLVDYLASQSSREDFKIKIKNSSKVEDIHLAISNFLYHLKNQQKQLQNLELKYKEFTEKLPQQLEPQPSQQEIDEDELDSIIHSLKQQIAHEKRLCLRYEKQEKFLMNKLYFTQKKNNDLKSSSTNLQIKNMNLRDQLKFKPLNSASKKQSSSPKLQRSFSVKLQRIKRYNLQDNPTLIKETHDYKTNNMTRSKSASNLQGFYKGSYLLTAKKNVLIF